MASRGGEGVVNKKQTGGKLRPVSHRQSARILTRSAALHNPLSYIFMLERPKMRTLCTLLLAAGLLTACDPQRIEKLEEGLSTEADVRKQFGEPTLVVERADGSKQLEYPRQPEGWTNYQIEIGADGKMSSLRQLVTPTNFAKVQPGMTQDAVRRLLGRTAKTWNFPTKPEEEIWDWRFQEGQAKKIFSVTFGAQRQVLSTAITEDTRGDQPGR